MQDAVFLTANRASCMCGATSLDCSNLHINGLSLCFFQTQPTFFLDRFDVCGAGEHLLNAVKPSLSSGICQLIKPLT